jgi:hypothetical protein
MALPDPVNYSPYKHGTTRIEVTERLGRPSSDPHFLIPLAGTAPPPRHEAVLPPFFDIVHGTWSNWIRTDCIIVVVFDNRDRVIGKGFISCARDRDWISVVFRIARHRHVIDFLK